jgi:hypothetical protein
VKDTRSGSLILANWGRRFIAWFVDYLIINVVLAYFNVEQIETALIPARFLPRLPGSDISIWSPISIFTLFLYWTMSEWYFGRSIGQLLLNLRLVDLKGKGVTLMDAAIQSVGKSLLLPFDCLIGWIYEPARRMRQRLFNKLSNTIVIFIGKPTRVIRRGKYELEL